MNAPPVLFPARLDDLLWQRKQAVHLALQSKREDLRGWEMQFAVRLNERVVEHPERLSAQALCDHLYGAR